MSSSLLKNVTMPSKVVFLDRDGVINQDSDDYITSWDKFTFIPGSLEALARFHQYGFDTIVITNQSMINRGLAPLANLEEILTNMRQSILESGGHVLDIFYCPHTPDENCTCRKPKPGMLQAAQKKYGYDLSTCYMIGDSAKDIECAINARCGWPILVETGNGKMAQKQLRQKNISPAFVAADLNQASKWIIQRLNGIPQR